MPCGLSAAAKSGRIATAIAATINTSPVVRAVRPSAGINFSANTIAAMSSTHGRLIAPATTRSAPIRNPVSGAESHPGVVLPEGIIFKRGDLGTSTRFRVSNGIEYDHSGKYLAVGPFSYAWP